MNKTVKQSVVKKKDPDGLNDENETELEEAYLMCVDPDSKKTFKINIG